MKKLLSIIAIMFFSFSVYAQKTEEIKVSELPKNVTAWIAQNLKKTPVERAGKVMDNKTLLGYCAGVQTKGRKIIFVFDKNGKYLEKIGKMTELQRIFPVAKPVTQPSIKKK